MATNTRNKIPKDAPKRPMLKMKQAMQSTRLKTACRKNVFGEPSSMPDSRS